MECPYCHGELEPGTHVSGYGSWWVPKGERIGLFMSESKIKRAGGFKIGRAKTVFEAEAWYCRTCKRLTLFNVE